MTSPLASGSSSRLVSKLCVHGRVPASSAGTSSDAAEAEASNGVRIDLFCKINVPLAGGSQSYPLFPDRRVRLLSSSAHPLSQHATLVLTPPPSPSILDAARHLRIGTTFDWPLAATPSSARSGAGAHPVVKVAVQDFAICLLTEGGNGSIILETSHKNRGKLDTLNPTPQGVSGEAGVESAPWIVVLELFVPWLSAPPLDRTAIVIPLPRCLSNTLSFHLLLPPQGSEGTEPEEYSFMTSPKLLSSGTAAAEGDVDASPDDLILAGTFQSTPQLEIRWRPAPPGTTEGRSSASDIGAFIPGQAVLQDLRQTVEWSIGPLEVSNNHSAATVVAGLKAHFEGNLHYAGVESVAYLNAGLSFPATSLQSIEWLSPPVFTADRALASFHPSTTLSSELATADQPSSEGDASFDTSTLTIQSPSPSHARTKSLSQQSSLEPFSRTTSGGSSSQSSSLPSLLRQKLPSAHLSSAADVTAADISFAAFDSSAQTLSPDVSPSQAHESPLRRSASSVASGSGRRRKGTSETEARTSLSWRIGVEVSKAHESEGRWRLEWSGELRLQVDRGGHVELPDVSLRQTNDLAGVSTFSIKTASGWDVLPPAGATQTSTSSSRVKVWTVASSMGGRQFALMARLQSLSDASAGDFGTGSTSPRRTTPVTMRHRRRASSLISTVSPLQAGPGRGYSGMAPDPNSSFWANSAPPVESLPQVLVETLLLPSTASVQQVTRMRVGLPLPAIALSEDGEGDTFEFGIVAAATESAASPNASSAVRILSATLNSLPVEWDLQLPSPDSSKEEQAIPGALGYIQLRAAGLRAIGGEVCVRFAIDRPLAAMKPRWIGRKGKEREQAIVIGLPSFEEEVAWLDTRIETVEGSIVDLVSSTSTLVPLSRSTLTGALRLVSHSLLPLSTPVLSVALRPSRSLPPVRSPSFSWTALASLLLLFWLLASVGLEIREVKDRLANLGLSVRHLVEEGAPATTRLTTQWVNPLHNTETATSTSALLVPTATKSTQQGSDKPAWADEVVYSSPSVTSSSSTILRPTFTSILLPPMPLETLVPRPDAVGRPLSYYFPALLGLIRRTNDVLDTTAVGRGLRNIVVCLGRTVAWVIFG